MKTTCTFVRALLLVASLLLSASLTTQAIKYFTGHARLLGITDLLNVNGEVNIPTFFSVLLLLTCSSLLGFVAYLKKTQRADYSLHWLILSLGFLFMAADEFMGFHERLNELTDQQVGLVGSTWLKYSWVIPGLFVITLIGISYVRFLQHLASTHRIRFMLAGAIYCTGIIGVEMLGAHHAALYSSFNFTYSLLSTLEEGMEMMGLILFINALIHYTREQYPHLRIRP
jgi:hypothetical protein